MDSSKKLSPPKSPKSSPKFDVPFASIADSSMSLFVQHQADKKKTITQCSTSAAVISIPARGLTRFLLSAQALDRCFGDLQRCSFVFVRPTDRTRRGRVRPDLLGNAVVRALRYRPITQGRQHTLNLEVRMNVQPAGCRQLLRAASLLFGLCKISIISEDTHTFQRRRNKVLA